MTGGDHVRLTAAELPEAAGRQSPADIGLDRQQRESGRPGVARNNEASKDAALDPPSGGRPQDREGKPRLGAFGWVKQFFRTSIVVVLSVFALLFAWEFVNRNRFQVTTIAVPETLSKSGLTSEVAAHRVGDLILKVLHGHPRSVRWREGVAVRAPVADMPRELPEITIPQAGISIRSLEGFIRSFVPERWRHDVSGEFVELGEQLSLRVRLNGKVVFFGQDIEPGAADRLLQRATPATVEAMYRGRFNQDLEEWIRWFGRKVRVLSPELLSRWNNSSLHSDLGWFLYVGRRFDEAVDEFEEARQLNPGTAGPLIDLGNVLIDSHKLDKASEIYRKAIELDEEAAGTVVGLANVMVEQHKYLEAEVQYRRAISLDQTIAAPHVGLAMLLAQQKKIVEAAAELQKAALLDPTDAVASMDFGILLTTQDKTEEAETQFRKAMHIDPTDGHRTYSWAACL